MEEIYVENITNSEIMLKHILISCSKAPGYTTVLDSIDYTCRKEMIRVTLRMGFLLSLLPSKVSS